MGKIEGPQIPPNYVGKQTGSVLLARASVLWYSEGEIVGLQFLAKTKYATLNGLVISGQGEGCCESRGEEVRSIRWLG